MADEKALELDKSGKKKKMIIIIAIVAILAIGGGVAFFFMSGGEDVSQAQLDAVLSSGQSSPEGGESTVEQASMGTALYVPMPRPFRFNVPGAARDRFVEIRVQLLVRGSNNEEATKKHIPLVESTLLAVFTQSNADDLATSAGKTSLKQKALAEVQKVMTEVEDGKIIEQVLFTGFVMQ
ncbi:flagellar basal body-associated protein FliL [Thalassotalea profundi]|uniref:Flagellar protein FliL n=1 Tax=Thalassotalea profundi TaxID=2036687 RepID=A0ABQ3IJP3_9GAMM|nr:flagellar basal body-associated protein FliL [Thalassotalea profundi]GHE80839.1 flagellar basal body-associated protein FliL [Thalassotalea profundi]